MVAGDAASLCVTGLALGDMDIDFAWQAGVALTALRNLELMQARNLFICASELVT